MAGKQGTPDEAIRVAASSFPSGEIHPDSQFRSSVHPAVDIAKLMMASNFSATVLSFA
jgi:hypothetical protein